MRHPLRLIVWIPGQARDDESGERDLATLVAGGYRIKRIVPIDQFLWSPHVEAVATLEKPVKK